MKMYRIYSENPDAPVFQKTGVLWLDTQEKVDKFVETRKRLAPRERHVITYEEWIPSEPKPVQSFPLKVDHRFPLYVCRK